MYPVRLSPSGPIIGNLPGFDDGAILRSVYFGAFPNVDAVLTNPAFQIFETFDVALPLVWPGDDPPEVFDPAKLTYVIWVNAIVNNEGEGRTEGPYSANLEVVVDAPAATVVPIEDIIDDVAGTYSAAAGQFLLRSAIHQFADEQIDQIDVIDATKFLVFRPATIPLWTAPATAWVAGQTRHIYVRANKTVEAPGVPAMPARQSRVVILEFYGTVPELIGVGGPGVP
jgi:hypothetical protein